MEFLKHNITRIILLLAFLSAGIFGFYSLSDYNNNSASAATQIESRSSIGDEMNRGPGTSNHNRPEGQFNRQNSDQHMPPSGTGGPRGSSSEDAQYAPLSAAYALGFLLLATLVCYLFRKKKIQVSFKYSRVLIFALFGTGLLLRYYLAISVTGHPFDLNLFKNWASSASNNLLQFYSHTRCDYPPLYIYVLALIGKIAALPSLNSYYILILKLPSMLADLATSYLIYRLARKRLSLEISLLLGAFYMFNPAVLINSSMWGQVDSFFTLIIVSSLYLLSEEKIGWSSVLFAAAVLMKPQGIVFLPVLFFELLRQKNIKKIIMAAVCGLGAALVIIMPFSWHEGALWIFKLFSGTLAEYPYASVNAFNLFGLLGANYKNDASTLLLFSYHSWGMIFIVLITALAGLIYLKGKSPRFAYATALLLIAGVFVFSARMHERYLFPAAALSILAFIYLQDKRLLWLSAGFSSTIFINTHSVFFATVAGNNNLSSSPALIFTAILNLILFIYLVKVLYDIAKSKDGLVQ